MALQMLIDIALGEEGVAHSYYETFKRTHTKNND